MSRPLTPRERAVLDLLLGVEFDGVEGLRDEAQDAVVVSTCSCGCPSIDFYNEPGVGMNVRVNARIQGTHDGLFLYSIGDRLGGIEYVDVSDAGDPGEFPDPSVISIATRPAG